MFNRIAGRYDFLNRLLSMRIDVAWRKRMIPLMPVNEHYKVLDVATGTADVLLTLSRDPLFGSGLGVDMSDGMLGEGRLKICKKGLGHALTLIPGDALFLPCVDNSFDAVTIAFGIRNVIDVEKALREMYRVVKKSGRILVLEFSIPGKILIKNLYLFYFRHILPILGGIISGDHKAYGYLNKTVESFPYGEAFCKLLLNAGFNNVRALPLTFGIATLYYAEKHS